MNRNLSIVLASSIFLGSCIGHQHTSDTLDTPTAGTITIAADESLKPVVDAQVAAFMAIYSAANIHIRYAPEDEVIRLLQQDSARLAWLTRSLNTDELAPITARKLMPNDLIVAHDAITVIASTSMPDSVLSVQQLRDLLSGKQVGTDDRHVNSVDVVFDHRHSSTARYIKDSLHLAALGSHCYAAKGPADVIQTVIDHPHTLGLVGVSWIRHREGSLTTAFTQRVRVLALRGKDQVAYQPYQAYMAQQLYPLTRDLHIVNVEARTGLGNGFTAFVAGDKGQRIMLKAGLVPATMPVRIIEVNHETL